MQISICKSSKGDMSWAAKSKFEHFVHGGWLTGDVYPLVSHATIHGATEICASEIAGANLTSWV